MEFQSHEKSLYERIGGADGVEKLIEGFYSKVVADPEIGYYFTHVPMGKLIPMQREFFANCRLPVPFKSSRYGNDEGQSPS